ENFFNDCMQIHGTVFIETDMRAMYNPTRMKVIASCTQKLIEKMRSTCPKCQYPGFSVTEAVPGLPCSLCTCPTRSTLTYIFECQLCKYSDQQLYPLGKTAEDPMYCDNCNP
ncbi:MAG: DUF6671 family protein, partial [Bacteroidota bacterium]